MPLKYFWIFLKLKVQLKDRPFSNVLEPDEKKYNQNHNHFQLQLASSEIHLSTLQEVAYDQ